MRINLFLLCEKCAKKHQNYRTSRAKKPQQNTKLSLKKYCKFCQKSQVHKEQIIKQENKKDDKDENSIGLILCKTKDGLVAEYALRDSKMPIGIAEYKISESLPDNIKGELPSIEEIEERMEKEINELKTENEKLRKTNQFYEESWNLHPDGAKVLELKKNSLKIK